jgi:predicted secreted acid phosphatase
MKFFMSRLILVLLCLLPTLSSAQEPINLADIKNQLIKYHDSGEYATDIKIVNHEALQYLKQRLQLADFQGKKPAIVLDIDETSLSNYQDMVKLNFGGTLKEIIDNEDKGSDPAIQTTLTLYQFARAHNVAVFFVTGRFEYERKATETNLEKAGYKHWDKLVLREGKYTHATAAEYKAAIRKQLAANYDILINMGDQYSDLAGGYADKTFKLPNPYYFIP